MLKFKVTFPYDQRLNKNKMFMFNRRTGTRYCPHKKFADLLFLQALCAYRALGKKFEDKKKVYIRIFVRRPTMMADPANFIDVILDIIKRVVEVDDRWYSGSWDWELVDRNACGIDVEVMQ